MDDRVSIVMPAYNASAHIEDAIASAQAQTHPNWELLVVDDASGDATGEIVGRLAAADERIHLLRHDVNLGPGSARNTGLASATGRWLAFLDADDLWMTDKLERQLEFMRRKDAVFSFTGYRMMDVSGRDLGRTITVPARIDYRGLLKNTIIGTTFSMFDRQRLPEMRMPDMLQHEDLALWFDILRGGVVAHGLQAPLAWYRIVTGSNSANKFEAVRVMWELYRRHERLNPFDAAWCFTHYAWNAYRKYRGLRV
jgi:teichuronic acid biosynthesis glycosyltransferase TuaG